MKSPILLLFALYIGSVVAPFPAQHRYSFLNVFIEPLWDVLTEQERDALYAGWKPWENAAFDMADAVHAAQRALNLRVGSEAVDASPEAREKAAAIYFGKARKLFKQSLGKLSNVA